MASLEGTSSELVETTVSSEFDSDSEESSNSEEPEVCVPSLLDRLKCRKLSDLARKRKLQTNPPKGKRKSRGEPLLVSHLLFLH